MKKIVSLLVVLTIVFSFAACGKKASGTAVAGGEAGSKVDAAESSDPIVVKLGISIDEPEIWEAVQKNLEKDNIKLEVIYFSEYVWNTALANGEIDIAAAQHHAWFENNIKEVGLEDKVVWVADMCTSPLNIFSKTVDSLDDIPEGGTIAIPADAVNLGRALQILEKAGVITLGDYEGIPEIADIAENPKNINIQEIDGQSLPRSLQDVDAAVIQIGFAVAGGLDLDSDNIFKDTIDMSDPVQYQFVRMIDVRAEDVDNEVLKKVVAAYQSPEVAQVIEEVYKGTVEPAFTY